ncbi:hypothetical protein ACMA1D_10855 [Streptomyces sp. 796.1]|uniref:hypothetical protein n=1 Tax=Streptomyces sp. 796.1 TaxID=3163029 RepID=UPI0039C996B7
MAATHRPKADCPICGKPTAITTEGRYWDHAQYGGGPRCDAAGTLVPVDRRPAEPPRDAVDDFFDQVLPAPGPRTDIAPMTPLGQEICGRLKEMFHAYDNRRAADNRSAQTHLGPSEIGTPCDRRLAMTLLDMPPVNPGGDGWAAFLGTCTHEGLARMLQWADAGTGRYATELPLTFPSALVPRGTGDVLDRTLCLFGDHKVMGQWSLNRLRTKGPPPVYRTQVHVYAHGARLMGETVDHVAIIGWPRYGATLDDLYVWTEPYDPTVPRDALARVDRIATAAQALTGHGFPNQMVTQFDTADDCRYCPFHAPGDTTGERGCRGHV